MRFGRAIPVAALLVCAACGGSEYTIISRDKIQISPNARVVSRALLPALDGTPVADHLALAEEVYEEQQSLLKQRRNKVRARRRGLAFASYGVLSATGLTAGSVALAEDSSTARAAAGGLSLAGVGLAAILQIASLAQEDYGDVDAKLRHLEDLHEALLERLRDLAARPRPDAQTAAALDAQLSAALERFIHDALRIQVKG
jgi:hypothetical protein